MRKVKRSYNFWIYQGPALAWALLIFILSSIPGDNLPQMGFEFEDKFEHFLAYAAIGFLFARAFFFQSRFPGLREKYILATLAAGILFGVSDELHQYFVPGRVSDLYDLIADALGVVMGVFLFRALLWRGLVSET
ncbi:MAG: VanZ family protein [Calditrichaceae bacterium]|nr:VanZ family protein [Calditrichia bacterium]NUQ42922.1 VanZ family protein [Calditrichaceae bacterium]